MSEHTTTRIATPTKSLSSEVAAAAAAATGAALLAIGAGLFLGCREVHRKWREDGRSVERLMMTATPISNPDGLRNMLESEGFSLSPMSSGERPFALAGDTGYELAIAQKPSTSESLIIVTSAGGTGFISDSGSLLNTSMQGFAVQEISAALKSSGYGVSVAGKGDERIITATDADRNDVRIEIAKGGTSAHIDTRRTRRPKCDLVHQLITEKVDARPGIAADSGAVRRRGSEHQHVRG